TVFEAAINMEGIVKSTRMDIHPDSGLVRMTASGDITVAGAIEAETVDVEANAGGDILLASDIQAYALTAKAEGDIEVNNSIAIGGGDIALHADHEADGVGEFTQNAEMISTTGAGSILIDGAGAMTLRTLKTQSGAIKIGTRVAPATIRGAPHFIHTEGEIEITAVEQAGTVTTLRTARGDVLKYATEGAVTLEAEKGGIIEVPRIAIPARHLKVVGSDFIIISSAATTEVSNNSGSITINEISYIEEGQVTIKGEGAKSVTYLAANNLYLETPRGDVNTAIGVVIPGNEVKVSARKFGSRDNPVGINANITYINRLQGDIDVTEMWGLGTTLCIRGPAPSPSALLGINVSEESRLSRLSACPERSRGERSRGERS
ncbi:MAG: DUF4097 domain-containing protein, partial [Candidatus Omnitrophica bacterium]|nr:DUF4097 domain-containing protein [Candidatus Omnitrophota bacterium]